MQPLSISASGFKTKRAEESLDRQNCSQTTCGQTFVFRHMQQNWQGREWSQSVPLTMWVFTGTNLSVTQSFPPINWWQKASPTSSTTQVSSSGAWTKENDFLSPFLDWLGRQSPVPPGSCPLGQHWPWKNQQRWQRLGWGRGTAYSKDGGWNLRFHPSGHVCRVMQRTHTHKACNCKILILGKCFTSKKRSKKAINKVDVESWEGMSNTSWSAATRRLLCKL